MAENVNYQNHEIYVGEHFIGCHKSKVFYAKVYHEDHNGPIHVSDYYEDGETALQKAKKWVDEK
jgi:hypothetical protein